MTRPKRWNSLRAAAVTAVVAAAAGVGAGEPRTGETGMAVNKVIVTQTGNSQGNGSGAGRSTSSSSSVSINQITTRRGSQSADVRVVNGQVFVDGQVVPDDATTITSRSGQKFRISRQGGHVTVTTD